MLAGLVHVRLEPGNMSALSKSASQSTIEWANHCRELLALSRGAVGRQIQNGGGERGRDR